MKLRRLVIALLAIFSLPLTAFSYDQSVLFVSGSHGNNAKVALLADSAKDIGLHFEHSSVRELGDISKAATRFSNYNLVIFAGVSQRDTKNSFEQYTAIIPNTSAKYMSLKWIENEQLRAGVSIDQADTVSSYYSNGGAENMARLGEFLKYRILTNNNDASIKPPIVFPEVGIYHPKYENLIFEDLDSYLQWRKSNTAYAENAPIVGVLFQRAAIESETTDIVDTLLKKIEGLGALTVPFFFELSPNASDYTPLLKKNGETFVDVIANLRSIHWASKRREEFENLGVPVLQSLVYTSGNQQHWEENSQGISPGMSPFQLVLPESAGVVDPVIIAATNTETRKSEIIDYQINFFAQKVHKVAQLKHKTNSDKKITVMVWGNRDVGASFLNIPESLRSISENLNKASYNINAVDSEYFTQRIDRMLNPFYRSYELDALLEDDLAELMPVNDYLSWFNTLPEHVRTPINEHWGNVNDNFMVVKRDGEHYFVLPRIRNGNMLVMRQPPRADNDDEDKRIFHKGTIPMNHYYLAAYYYARKYWGSDAIVHLGTHGSHEYLPGKERGLSMYDQGNLATWDTPVVYPFIVDDVGEAMQTKRRGSATVIAHMTPPFAAAGLQGDIADLHELMHQYKSLDDGGVKEKTGAQLIEDCVANNICDDIGWEASRITSDFDTFLEELHSYMEDLASANQPLGLHTFGGLPEPRLITSTLVQMLGPNFSNHAAEFEARHYDHHEDTHESNHKHHHDDADHLNKSGDGSALENIAGFKTVRDFVIDGGDISTLPKALQEEVKRGQDLYADFIASKEMEHMLNFLSGKYIPVKTGGDPIRHPDSLATGFNLYGFDPSRVPTKAAYEQGKELTAQLIEDYYDKHGHYPDKLAFSLWSMETMRHYGVLESQALYAMGVKPVWSPDGRVIDTEIIPANELKRPRVDVVLSATGLYRDAFPNVLQWLAKAVRKVTELKEESNSLWHNAKKVEQELIEAGVEAEEAQYLSTVRIFSNESGNYGSGLGDATIASDQWESDSKLADLYLARMGYFYGEDDSRWGQKAPEGIDLYAKTLSGTDMALFSRSSNVFGLLASDDPFQYFGGLALAVRNIDGKSPEMYISNLRDANRPKSENAATFLAKEVRTRAFHPRWVEEMKKEGYSGATTMASTVSNFFGWQVMDPNLVRNDQWQEFFEVYVNDKLEQGLNEWFEKVDPKAQAAIIEHMLEATRKEYWETNSETIQTLIERYSELVNKYDLVVTNEKLREFVQTQAAGFGLNLALPAPEVAAMDISSAQPIEGQKLEKVEQSLTQSDVDWTIFYILFACLSFVVIGALRQAGMWQSRQNSAVIEV